MQQAAVSLVSMPFKDLRHPPIQLGLLECCLTRVGITARSHSLELAFMEHLHAQTAELQEDERLSISDYQRVAHKDFVVNLGDWIFKVPPYAEMSEDAEYLEYVRTYHISERDITNAIRMRALAPTFLNTAADEILSSSPRVVGFSSVFQQNVASLVLAKILKLHDPSLVIIFGGDNCDGAMGAALHESFPWVDVVVRGEGERVLVEVVRDILASSTIRPQPGLCYRPNGASVVIPMETRPQLSIDEVPQPTYDEYFSRLERSALRAELLPEVAILFESSRGCWWGAKQHCTFCGLNNATMAFRSKPAARVADEILDLAERYKVLSFVAVDDIIDLTHIRDLLPMLSYAGCDLSIFYETKANLKKEQLRAMYSAGVTAIQPGIESLSTPILQLMRKGVTALQNIRLLKWCAEFGIVPAWNLLYGFPGEPQEEYERMCDLVPSLVHLEAPNISPIQLQRFSPYFERAAEFGLKIMGPLQQYKHLYQISSEALWNLAYDFDHSYSDGRDPQSYTENIVGAIQQWRESSSKAFGTLAYFRGPGFIIVQDRRPGLDPNDYRFDGPEAKIYLGCDAGATPEELEKQLAIDAEEDLSSDEIREFLEEVVNARLMYREGNRYLSLATAASGSSSRTLRIAS